MGDQSAEKAPRPGAFETGPPDHRWLIDTTDLKLSFAFGVASGIVLGVMLGVLVRMWFAS